MLDIKDKKTLILHIGIEKTGTTSIQKFLEINYFDLKKQGITCPKSLCYSNSFNHRWAALIAYNAGRNDDNTKKVFSSKAERSFKVKQKLNEFRNEFNSQPSNTWIISSEHLQSRLKTKDEIKKLRNIFSDLFDEIKILVYIRDPLEIAISWWSTRIKSEALLSQLPKPDNRYIQHLCNHKKTILQWGSIFKIENIIVGFYKEKDNSKEDIIFDFCKKLNIDISSLKIPKFYENKKLSLLGMKYKLSFNKNSKKLNLDHENDYLLFLSKKILNYTSNDKFFYPNNKQIREYENAFKKSNEWVNDQFLLNEKNLSKYSLKKSVGKANNLKLSDSEERLFIIIFDLIKFLIDNSKNDFREQLLKDLENSKNLLKKHSRFKFFNFFKYKFNQKIIKFLIFLNKNYKKFLFK